MSAAVQDDPELFARFRDGDPDAFRRLVEQHRPALEACARRRLHHRVRRRVSIADIVQEAHVVAYEYRARFRGNRHDELRKWLIAIVANRARKAIDQHVRAEIRAIGQEITRATRSWASVLHGRDGTPSQAVAASELASLAERARVVLSKEDEELLDLVHDEGLSLRAAAAQLGRSYEAVRKQHARALRRLGRAFQKLREGP